MKVAQLRGLLETYAATLTRADAAPTSAILLELTSALSPAGAHTTAKFLDTLKKAGPSISGGSGATLGDCVPCIEGLAKLLDEAGAKKATLAAVNMLLDLLRDNARSLISGLESTIQSTVASASRAKPKRGAPTVDTGELIEAYLAKLDAALGHDATFRAVYNELCADKRIGKSDAVGIASRFFAPIAPSTSRPKALLKVLERHEKLMESRSASSTIGGRAA